MRLRLLAVLAALLISLTACSPSYHRFQAQIIGPFDTVTVFIGYAQSPAAFDRYSALVFERLEYLHQLYDIFGGYGDLNNLHTINAQAGIFPVGVSQEIVDMLTVAREAYDLTGGQTNAALGPVLRIWHDYRAQALAEPNVAQLPSLSALEEAAAHISMADVVIDAEKMTVFLRHQDMSLDVGSVAKGYAAGLAMDAATQAGLESALLNVGGHVVAVGSPHGRDHWNVAIQNPEADLDGASPAVDTIYLTDATVSISGVHQRFYVVDEQTFGHIIDPSTLMPANLYKQVAVIHPSSWLADVLSTALFILPQAEGAELVAAAGAEALWIDLEGNWFATPGYQALSRELKDLS
ncbi:MAG: FAD:protein FMN transferase [Oscillospiraceae bacterium]|nr:FAD:protein FMN transferase [Oscillospiraceae bacterium]